MKREMTDEIKKNVQTPPPAPIASAMGPCPTIIQIVGLPGTGSLSRTIAPPDHPLLPKSGRERRERIDENKNVQTIPSAPTASAVGPCPTVIQIVGRPGTGSLPSTIAPPDYPHFIYSKVSKIYLEYYTYCVHEICYSNTVYLMMVRKSNYFATHNSLYFVFQWSPSTGKPHMTPVFSGKTTESYGFADWVTIWAVYLPKRIETGGPHYRIGTDCAAIAGFLYFFLSSYSTEQLQHDQTARRLSSE